MQSVISGGRGNIMQYLFRLSGGYICYRCLVLAFLCILNVQAAIAGDIFHFDNADLYSRKIEVAPSESIDDTQPKFCDAPLNLQLRNNLIIGTGVALVTVYGSNNWWQSGFGGGFDTTNEGWFGSGTAYGGTDKLGHMYINYAGVRLLSPLFESAGNNRDDSLSLALWSSLGIYTAVEVVDGFSRHWKFSPQDVIANIAGAALGVTLETNPELDAMFDFRIDYRRSPRSPKFDPFGDYSAQKYLFVVKADGFELLRENSYLRYFEAAIGYGTQGYDTGEQRQRNAYLGLSLNLSRLLADGAYGGRMHSTAFQRGTDRLFDLVQFPTIGYAQRNLD